MTSSRVLTTAAMSVILALEVWMVSNAFDKFFNHDSLFYLIHSPRSFEELLHVFAAPDPARQYRPLSLVFTALVVPWFGTNPVPYHWIPLIFHAVNTWLVFRLASRLLPQPVSAVAAAGFWGLHSVVVWITYDLTCISDFMMTFFMLASLLMTLEGTARKSRARLAGALALFVCALLTKEAAVTFVIAVPLCLGLAELRGRRPGSTSEVLGAVARHTRVALPFLALTAVHAGLLTWWLRAGTLYAQGPASAYDINPLANFLSKSKYLFWALNLPDELQLPRGDFLRLVALGVLGCLFVIWAVDFVARKGKLSAIEWAGLLWFAGWSVPALMLSSRLAKWYLYAPLVGLALVFGSLAGRLLDRVSRFPAALAQSAIWSLLLGPVFFSTAVQLRSYLVWSDAAYSSQVLENCVREFQEVQPVLPSRATLFLLPSFEKNLATLLKAPPIEDGKLYELFYPRTEVDTKFADLGDRLPDDYRHRADLWVLQFLNGHLYDVTEYYKGRRLDNSAERVVTNLDSIQAVVTRDEFYPTYERFLTPTGRPVFYANPEHNIMTQIGGSTVVVPLQPIKPGAVLVCDVSWMFDAGDGGWAEMRVKSGGMDSVLFREYMPPNPKGKGLRWKALRLSLDSFAHRAAELVLRCYNKAGNNTAADWLNWRDIAIVTSGSVGERSN